MAKQIDKVKRGDLITAAFMNQLIEAVNSLDTRVSELESVAPSEGAVAITELIPSGSLLDPIRVDGQLQILGRNFRYSINAHRVFFDSVEADQFNHLESSDSKLVLTVPELPSLPTTGRPVDLRVDNGISSATRTITVLPEAQTLEGSIDLVWRDDLSPNPDPNPIAAGQPATFGYKLTSGLTLDATLLINAVPSIAEWRDLIQVLDASHQVIPSKSIRLASGAETDFYIRITEVPSGTNGTPFFLNVAATADGKSGTSAKGFTVGVPVEPQDPDIEVSSPKFTAIVFNTGKTDPDSSYSSSDNTIRLKQGSIGTMAYEVTFIKKGTFELTRELAAGTAKWQIEVDPSQIVESSDNITENVELVLRPMAGASATGGVTFRIRRQGSPLSQLRFYKLALL